MSFLADGKVNLWIMRPISQHSDKLLENRSHKFGWPPGILSLKTAQFKDNSSLLSHLFSCLLLQSQRPSPGTVWGLGQDDSK